MLTSEDTIQIDQSRAASLREGSMTARTFAFGYLRRMIHTNPFALLKSLANTVHVSGRCAPFVSSERITRRLGSSMKSALEASCSIDLGYAVSAR